MAEDLRRSGNGLRAFSGGMGEGNMKLLLVARREGQLEEGRLAKDLRLLI